MQFFGRVNFANEAHLLRHLRRAPAKDGRGELVAGFVDQRPGKVLAFADDHAFRNSRLDDGPVCIFGNGEAERLDALIFTIAAVGVGVEIADEGTFDGWACGGRVGQPFGEVREGQHDLANPARLGETDRGSGSVSHLVNGDPGKLAKAHDEKPFGRKPRRGVQENRLIRAGFEFPGGKNAGCGCQNRRLGGQQGGPGLGVGAVGGLGVSSQGDEELSLDFSG